MNVFKCIGQCGLMAVLVLGMVPAAAFADELAGDVTAGATADAATAEMTGEEAVGEPKAERVLALDSGLAATNDDSSLRRYEGEEEEVMGLQGAAGNGAATSVALDGDLATVADSDIITVEAQVRGVNTEGWRVFVSYARPKAGVPTEFTISVEGGPTGPYQYQQGFISKDGAYVYDPSFGSFDPPQDSDVLSYEFVGTGRYEYQFLVQPAGKLNKRFSINVDVSGDGFVDADTKAREIVDACLPDGNQDDYETALALHDWIIDNVSYDYTFRNLGVDRALAGMAVTCEGYHAAYVKLLETAGLQTGRINGDGHVWTAVKMDGEWYHIDTTHDDVKDGLSDTTAPGALTKEQQAHMLFGLNDDIMKLVDPKHQWSGANSLENNYFIRTGDILEWSDPIADVILDKLNKKETSFTVRATNAGWAQDDFKNIINNLVAYELNQYEWTTDDRASDAVVHVSYADDYYTVSAFTVLSAVPTVSRGLTYNGASQVGVTVPDAGKYVLSGTTRATSAGTYTAKVTPAAGYAWDKSGDRTPHSYSWKIAAASLASSAVSATVAQASCEYTGTAIRPKITVKHNGRTLKEGADYSVTYGSNTSIGKGTATIRGIGTNYVGSKTVSFDIVAPKNKWVTMGGKKYYYNVSGQPAKWSQKIDGSWYYFNGSGVMQTGWVTWKDGTKSYFDWDGRALLGWRSFSGVKYYFDPSTGISKRWSQKIDGKWYYFDGSSRMQKGWVAWKDGTKSYFHPDSSGHAAALLGWRSFSGVKYYFDPATGISKRWSQRLGGYWYYFDSASRMKTGWVTWKDGRKSYFNWDGKALTGWRSFNGVKYYFDPVTGMTR